MPHFSAPYREIRVMVGTLETMEHQGSKEPTDSMAPEAIPEDQGPLDSQEIADQMEKLDFL